MNLYCYIHIYFKEDKYLVGIAFFVCLMYNIHVTAFLGFPSITRHFQKLKIIFFCDNGHMSLLSKCLRHMSIRYISSHTLWNCYVYVPTFGTSIQKCYIILLSFYRYL